MKFQRTCIRLLLLAMVGIMAASCKGPYYQVYEMGSNNLVQKDNSMAFENEDVRVLYNLWGEDGNVAFIVSNKTGKDIFVDMEQSFLIVNGLAKDYYRNREYAVSAEPAVDYTHGVGMWANRYKVSMTTKVVRTPSNSIVEHERQVICIPANSYKLFGTYSLSPALQVKCSKDVDMPKKQSNVADYSESASPLKANNRIAYSTDKNCTDLKFIDNDFYVVSIKNYSNKAAVEKVKTKENCYDRQAAATYQFKIGGPNKFYKTYKGGHFGLY